MGVSDFFDQGSAHVVGPATGEIADRGDLWDAGREFFRYNRQFNSRQLSLNAAMDNLGVREAYAQATGEPWSVHAERALAETQVDPREYGTIATSDHESLLDRLHAANPDLPLPTSEDLRQESATVSTEAMEAYDHAMNHYSGDHPGWVSFGAETTQALTDPINLLMMPFGGGGTTLGAMLLRAGAAGVVTEGTIQTQVVRRQAELGHEYTLGDAAQTVMITGIAGGLIAGGGALAERGIRALPKLRDQMQSAIGGKRPKLSLKETMDGLDAAHVHPDAHVQTYLEHQTHIKSAESFAPTTARPEFFDAYNKVVKAFRGEGEMPTAAELNAIDPEFFKAHGPSGLYSLLDQLHAGGFTTANTPKNNFQIMRWLATDPDMVAMAAERANAPNPLGKMSPDAAKEKVLALTERIKELEAIRKAPQPKGKAAKQAAAAERSKAVAGLKKARSQVDGLKAAIKGRQAWDGEQRMAEDLAAGRAAGSWKPLVDLIRNNARALEKDTLSRMESFPAMEPVKMASPDAIKVEAAEPDPVHTLTSEVSTEGETRLRDVDGDDASGVTDADGNMLSRRQVADELQASRRKEEALAACGRYIS